MTLSLHVIYYYKIFAPYLHILLCVYYWVYLFFIHAQEFVRVQTVSKKKRLIFGNTSWIKKNFFFLLPSLSVWQEPIIFKI